MTTLIIVPTIPDNIEFLKQTVNGVFEYFNDFHLLIVRNNYEGFAKAINYGLKTNYSYDYYMLLNDDVGFNKDILTLMKNKINENSKIGLVTIKKAFKINHAPFYCVLIKGQVKEELGLLDERFEVGECEDLDYCARLQDAGYIIDFIEEDVGHYVSRTMGSLPEELYQKKLLNKQKFKDKWKGTKWENAFGF